MALPQLLPYAELPSRDMNPVFCHVVLKILGLSSDSSIRYIILEISTLCRAQ